MGTNFQAGQYDHCQHISIHVPREGHDRGFLPLFVRRWLFQSTCPARGTTRRGRDVRPAQPYFNPRAPRGARPSSTRFISTKIIYFNPRAPRGARRLGEAVAVTPLRISIHVPREGHDAEASDAIAQSSGISIHVPREGHDFCSRLHACPGCHFNPRAPRGARRWD